MEERANGVGESAHLGVDGSGVIVAQVLTDGNADDAATVPDSLGPFEGVLAH